MSAAIDVKALASQGGELVEMIMGSKIAGKSRTVRELGHLLR